MYWDAADRDSFATVKGEKALHVECKKKRGAQASEAPPQNPPMWFVLAVLCGQLTMTYARGYPMAGLALNTFMLK